MSINQNSKKLTEQVNQTLRENRNVETAYNKIQHRYDYEHYQEDKPPIVHFDKTASEARRRMHHLRKTTNQ